MQIQEIVSAIQTNRDEFARQFLRAQANRPIRERADLVTVTQDSDDNVAFTAALTYASANGFLTPLLINLVDLGLERGPITAYMLKQNATNNAFTEAIVNAPAGFANPLLLSKGLIRGSRWTGRVLVNGKFGGSGILIGANLFLTAWHVVQSLFDGNGSPLEHVSLEVEFDNVIDEHQGQLVSNRTTKINAHKKWHVSHSRCTDEELAHKIPDDPQQLNECWDYVIIRLAKLPGLHRQFAKLDPRASVPSNNEKITVLQYPAGSPLSIDYADIVSPTPAHKAVPSLRFVHRANTLGGSSGGPCFDKEFSLVGIHQGAWPTPEAEPKLNRGMPITNIIAHIRNTIKALPSPDPGEMPIVTLDFKKPVIGCDDFISLLWRQGIEGEYRAIAIHGEPSYGKTFLLELLPVILHDASHLKIRFEGQNIATMSIEQMISLFESLIGTSTSNIGKRADFDSTTVAWLKAEVIPAILATLDQIRQGRTVWLMISELNKFSLNDELKDLWLLLYEQTVETPWLRVVLDGIRAVPKSLGNLAYVHRVGEKTLEQVVSFFKNALAETSASPVFADEFATIFGTLAFNEYRSNLNTTPDLALEKLSDDCKKYLMQAINPVRI